MTETANPITIPQYPVTLFEKSRKRKVKNKYISYTQYIYVFVCNYFEYDRDEIGGFIVNELGVKKGKARIVKGSFLYTDTNDKTPCRVIRERIYFNQLEMFDTFEFIL